MKHQNTIANLLEKERNALFSIDATALEEVALEKEKLQLHDWRDVASTDQLALLRNQAERNQRLMDSALAGLRKAADILAKHKINRTEISVYNHTGKRQTIVEPKRPTLEKKA